MCIIACIRLVMREDEIRCYPSKNDYVCKIVNINLIQSIVERGKCKRKLFGSYIDEHHFTLCCDPSDVELLNSKITVSYKKGIYCIIFAVSYPSVGVVLYFVGYILA